jgi:surface polysaccharide O-acyltransferase-like enzyme
MVRLSNYSFGIYLVHPLLMYLCTNLLGFSLSAFWAVWFIPVYSVFIFVLSYLLVKMVSMVPYLRKFVM